jgi:hypothetical protein
MIENVANGCFMPTKTIWTTVVALESTGNSIVIYDHEAFGPRFCLRMKFDSTLAPIDHLKCSAHLRI